jgi:hypothetical protein
MKTLMEGLLRNAVRHYAAHDHIWSDPISVVLTVQETYGEATIVRSRKASSSYCTFCSAIKLNNEVFTKIAEPNLYTTPDVDG